MWNVPSIPTKLHLLIKTTLKSGLIPNIPSPHPTPFCPCQAAIACHSSLCQSHENSLGVNDGGRGQHERTGSLRTRGFRKCLELRTGSCIGGGVACSCHFSWYTGCHFFSLIINWLSVSGSHNRQQLSSTLQRLYPEGQPDGTEAFLSQVQIPQERGFLTQHSVAASPGPSQLWWEEKRREAGGCQVMWRRRKFPTVGNRAR